MCLQFFKLVFNCVFFLRFISFSQTCLSKGGEAEWLQIMGVDYSDYFLLDFARLLCLPFAPSFK